MLDRERKRRWILIGLLLAGVVLRLTMIVFPRPLDDDTDVYLQLGQNLLHHGVYGFGEDGVVTPSLIRLPGYPLFLTLLAGKMWLVKLVQVGIDLLGCWLLARFLWVWSGERAGDIGLGLGCLCLFTSAYAGTTLTESLSVFAVAWGIWALGRMMLARKPGLGEVLPVAGAAGLAMLLRPDGVLLLFALLFAVVWYGGWRWNWRRSLTLGLATVVLATLPLVPWTARNWSTFHVFQPLAPRRVNDPGERVNLGFYKWLSTWTTEYVDTGTVYWAVGTQPIDIDDVEPWAWDSPAQKAATKEVLDAYNVHHDVTPELDARFAALAQHTIQAHPLQYYVWVPALKVVDMWLRPRTESFGLDVFWWRFAEHPWQSVAAVFLGLLNLGYVVLALVGFRKRYVPFARCMLLYIVARCVLLATMENPEPRYTLEAYPILIVAAACWLGGRYSGRWKMAYVVDQESDLTELFAESFPVVEGSGLEKS